MHSMSQSFILHMFVECLICVLGNRDEAVNKTDTNKQNSLCEIGHSFSYLENEEVGHNSPWSSSGL